MGHDLTEARARALRSFVTAVEACGSPSLREWAAEDGRALTTIVEHRDYLIAMGLLELTPGRARGLRLTARGKRVAKKLAR